MALLRSVVNTPDYSWRYKKFCNEEWAGNIIFPVTVSNKKHLKVYIAVGCRGVFDPDQ